MKTKSLPISLSFFSEKSFKSLFGLSLFVVPNHIDYYNSLGKRDTMFVKTVKVKKPNPIAVVIVLAAILVLIAVWVFDFGGGNNLKDKYNLPTNADRTAFLKDLGWDVSAVENDCKVVKIPVTFNEIYIGYNKLQKQQGFDLSDYKGKTVEIYTYDVYNYPDKPSGIIAHLVICESKLVAGDICSTELNGFMHGLMPIDGKGLKNNDSSADEQAIAPAQTTSPAETVVVIGTEGTDVTEFPEK